MYKYLFQLFELVSWIMPDKSFTFSWINHQMLHVVFPLCFSLWNKFYQVLCTMIFQRRSFDSFRFSFANIFLYLCMLFITHMIDISNFVATVMCWLYLTQNNVYLIWSDLILHSFGTIYNPTRNNKQEYMTCFVQQMWKWIMGRATLSNSCLVHRHAYKQSNLKHLQC